MSNAVSGVYLYLQMAQLSHGQFGGGDEKTLEYEHT